VRRHVSARSAPSLRSLVTGSNVPAACTVRGWGGEYNIIGLHALHQPPEVSP
jgi:hypothetical protein